MTLRERVDTLVQGWVKQGREVMDNSPADLATTRQALGMLVCA